MRNPTVFKAIFTKFLNLLVSLQFVLLPTHSWAQTSKNTSENLPINIQSIRKTLDLSPEENNIVQEKLARVNLLIDGVMQNNPANFIDEEKNQLIPFFDNEHIPDQLILDANSNKSLSLLKDQAELPLITFDKIEPGIFNKKLYLNGYNNGKLVATHVIPTANAAKLIHDPEFIIIIQDSGKVLAIDKTMMIQNIFRAPFSVHTIIEKVNNWPQDQILNVDAEFLTRGSKPFVEEELGSMNPSERVYLTHDLKNEVQMSAGDLVISEGGSNKKILGIYSRQAIYNIIEVKAKELVALQMLYSFEGYGQTFSEKKEALLQIGEQITNPTTELLELFSEDEKENFDSKKALYTQDKMNPLVAKFLANSSRKQIKEGVQASKALRDKTNKKVDNFTYSEWQQSYDLIKEQAVREIAEINEKLAYSQQFKKEKIQSRLVSTKKYDQNLVQNRGNLEKQLSTGNFSNITNHDGVKSIDYQKLLSAGTNNDFAFSHKLSPWYQRLNANAMKNIGKKFLRITAYISGGLVLGSIGHTIVTGLSVGDQFKLLSDIYHQSIFPIYLDGIPYWQTAIVGVTSLLALMPLSSLFGQMVPSALEGIKKLTKTGSAAREKIQKLVNTFKPITAWQTNITISCRGYARLLLPYYHKLLKVFRQPTIAVMKKGLNPFKRMKYAGKKRSLGFAPPLYLKNTKNIKSINDLKKIRIDKQKAQEVNKARNNVVIDMAKTKKQKEILAWTLATIVVSNQEKIDPATLLSVADTSLSIKNIENIHNNKKAKRIWKLAAREFLISLQKNSNGVDLNSIPDELMKEYYLEVKKIADRINNNNKIQNKLIGLKHSFNNMGSATSKGIAMYGVEDYEFLNSIVASPFVATQVKAEFFSDHKIVATVPSVVGDRANPETLNLPRGRDIVAHDPDGFMGNSLEHNYDVFNNTLAHLLMAGPATALIYQQVKPENTELYNPVEQYLLKPNARPEGLLKSAYTWAKGILSFNKSNLGGYYLKSFFKRFTTLQASLTFTLVARVFIGQQHLEAAFMAYALFWFAGVLTYGWPWTIISRGNQLLKESVANDVKKLKQARISIFDGLRTNDEVLLKQGYENLQDVYFENFGSSYKILKEELKRVSKNMKRDLPFKKIKSLLKQGKDMEAYTIVAEVINTYNEKRFTQPDLVKKKLKDLATGHSDISELTLQEKAKLLLEESLARPPQYNQANAKVPSTITFWFGAVFTTLLAVSLTVASFDPTKLTFGYIAGWAGKLALFYPIVFALTSSYTWNKIGKSKMYQRLKRFKSSLCANNYRVKP